MTILRSWVIVSTSTVLTFLVAWQVCERSIGMSQAAAQSLAGVIAGLIMGVVGSAIGHARRSTVPMMTSPPTRTLVGRVPACARNPQRRQSFLDDLAGFRQLGHRPVVCVITGGRGVGKTQLAAMYLRDCEAAGWPAVIWLSAETEAQIVDGWAKVSEDAGIRSLNMDPMAAARAAMQWLRGRGPALVVLDDLRDAAIAAGWLPTMGDTQVVITAVSHEMSQLGQATIRLGAFTDDEAVEYLSQCTGLGDAQGAMTLAGELANLPLALSHAAATVGRHYSTYSEYIQRLDSVGVDEHFKSVVGDPYPRRTVQAIELSIADLQRTDPTGAARVLLETMTVFASTGVSVTILGSGRDNSPISRRRLWRSRFPTAAEFNAAVWLLIDRSLASKSSDSGTLTLHRLVRRVLLEALINDGKLDRVVSAAIECLGRALAVNESQPATAAFLGEIVDQLSALGDLIERLSSSPGGPSARRSQQRVAMTIPHGRPSERDAITAVTVQSLVKLYLSPTVQAELQIRQEPAIQLGMTVVSICSRLLAEGHLLTASCRMTLAFALARVGRYGSAIAESDAVLIYYDRAADIDHCEILTIHHNRAIWNAEAGNQASAIAGLASLYAECVEVLGDDHVLTQSVQADLVRYQTTPRRTLDRS